MFLKEHLVKKIILGTIFLITLCTGITRADLIGPGETPWWEGLDTLSEEDKLQTCQQLKEDFPDIENMLDVLPTKKEWEMLGCRELLKKHAQEQAATNANDENSSKSPSGNADLQADSSKINSLQYGLSGLVALLLSAVAFILLWRTRKPNLPRYL